jgi:uncharacterized protein
MKTNKITTIVVAVFVVLTLLALSGFLFLSARNEAKRYDYIGKSEEQQNNISIVGEGKVTAIPDVAKVRLGVTSDKSTVSKAQEENTKKMNAVIEMLKAQGIEARDIKTETYNIYPKYDWSDGKSLIVGYTVSQAVMVKLRNTQKISEILRLAAEKGANEIGNLTFAVDDAEALKAEAREKAIKDAETKARALANMLNVRLGAVISFSEYAAPQYDEYRYGYGMGMESSYKSAAPSIETGENEIIMNVSITYEIL